MGAPKQRWSREEEEALKAGILKHGAGKWTAILKDAEFRSILALRSNVDLKDKYRNMGTVRSGERSGEASREKAAAALKRSKQNLIQDSSQLAPSGSNEDYPSATKDAETLIVSVNSPESSGQKQNSKLETLILKAIACMKDSTGSSITNISSYIEDNFKYVPDSRQEIGEKTKEMASAGKLEKFGKHKYKLAQNTNHSKGKFSKARSNEGRQKESMNPDGDAKNVMKNVDRPSNNAGTPPQCRGKTACEAAVEAAQAVARAEVLMAEAIEAQKQLELAEACAYASNSLLKKLDMEINRRNATAKVAEVS